MISSVEFTHTKVGEQSEVQNFEIDAFADNAEVDLPNQNIGTFGDFNIKKDITYANGETKTREINFDYKTELFLTNKSKGIILFQNENFSPHYFMENNNDGIMDDGEKTRLLFNLEIESTGVQTPLTVVRNEVDVTVDALGGWGGSE